MAQNQEIIIAAISLIYLSCHGMAFLWALSSSTPFGSLTVSFIRAIDEATHDVQLHPITLNPSSADSSLALSSHAHQSYLPPHKWVIYMAPSHLQGWPRCWPPRYFGVLINILWCMVPTYQYSVLMCVLFAMY